MFNLVNTEKAQAVVDVMDQEGKDVSEFNPFPKSKIFIVRDGTQESQNRKDKSVNFGSFTDKKGRQFLICDE